MLSNADFDHGGAFSSAAHCRCAKLCARALIGMLVHDAAADVVTIKDGNLRKVWAEYFSACTVSIATLYYCLLTPRCSASCAGPRRNVSLCASCVAASIRQQLLLVRLGLFVGSGVGAGVRERAVREDWRV